MFKTLKLWAVSVLAAVTSFFAVAANATIDITAVTTGITDAQTAVLAIIAALLALSIAIFGISMVYRFVHKKSGA
jgi:hypothetical protein